MAWNAEQKKRMQMEKTILSQYPFLGRTAVWGPNDEYVQVDLSTNACPQQVFKVRLNFPANYPDACPEMVLIQPKKLLQCDNKTEVPPVRHEFHTIGKSNDGLQKICHYIPAKWTKQNTAFKCFMKARLWLEAYMQYRITSKPMTNFIAAMPHS